MKLFFLGLLMISCAHHSKPLKINSWGIQLQGYEKNDSLIKIRDSKKDLWVVDPDPFSSAMVKSLRKNDKKLVAYLSLGEAEAYRSYFKEIPKDLILEENPNWKDNFSVKYWDERWKKIVDGSLERIQEKGFDGVFLDVIDAFERFPDKDSRAREMAALIAHVSREAKRRNPDFIVIMQNGLQIRRHLNDPSSLLDAVSAVNAENVFSERGEALSSDLAFYRKAAKPILSLEYIQDPAQRDEYLKFAEAENLLPLLSGKALDGTETAY